MFVSVALTTYQCKKYIREQLESIFQQTRLPDELVICDDASPDDSVKFLKKILAEIDTKGISRVFENKQNIGFELNFQQCIEKCKGDIIFISDQDDIWEPRKIEIMLESFAKNPRAIMAFCNATVIDAEGRIIRDDLNSGWDTRADRMDVTALTLLNIRQKGVPYGHSMAIKKELFHFAAPFPERYGHDQWLSLCAPLLGDVVTVEDKLVRYRRHSTNTSGTRGSIKQRLLHLDRVTWFTHAELLERVFETYLQRYSQLISDCIKEELEAQIRFQKLLNDISTRAIVWGGGKLLLSYFNGEYTRFRGTRNTLILDELYLLIHLFS